MLELLKKEVENYYSKQIEKLHKKEKSDVIMQYGTNLVKVKYKSGELEEEKAYKRALNRALKELNNNKLKKLNKIELVEKAEDLEYININIDWIYNRTWGYNPKVKVITNISVYEDSASGCGYDKESAAIARAFNQSNEILKVLYALAEKMIEKVGDNAYYYTGCGDCVSWRNSIGYGSGYDILPYFEGGVGISCFEDILNKCGYIWRCMGSSKRWDCYSIEKKGLKNDNK